METLSAAVGWANDVLTWAWVLWFGIGIVVGGIMLARDEWRLHRTKPKRRLFESNTSDRTPSAQSLERDEYPKNA